tara:strand:+ start:605 stop:1828 length:1224 start_codon:yes stop_codon:yes gene_type:complete
MPLPSVTINISDDTYLVEESETTSEDFLAGLILSNHNLVYALGTTSEVNNGFFQTNATDLYERLSSPQGNGAGISFEGFGGCAGTSGALYPSILAGGTGITSQQVRWPKGAVGVFANDFHFAQSAAAYGTKLVIGISGSNPFTSSNSHDLDCIFGTDSTADALLDTVMSARDNDCFAIRGVTAVESGEHTGDEFDIFVYGSKYSLPLGLDPEEISNDSEYNELRLTADVVGCLARTFRVADPWFSPAGMNRGQIKNVIKLKNPPTAAQANALYINKINPVLSFPGEGVVLFGNKTGAVSTSLLAKIEISSLFIYLKKKIGAIARSVLFEQNNPNTRQAFTNLAVSVLEKVKSRSGITEYTIKCDSTNNPPDVVNAGNFAATIFVKPARCVESLEITFTNMDDGEILG